MIQPQNVKNELIQASKLNDNYNYENKKDSIKLNTIQQ